MKMKPNDYIGKKIKLPNPNTDGSDDVTHTVVRYAKKHKAYVVKYKSWYCLINEKHLIATIGDKK